MEKSKTKEEISDIVNKLKQENKTIVTCNGSFDIFHIGHLRFLKEAKEQGDVLIVGLNSDNSVKIYKSKDRPIFTERYRAEILNELNCVDYIVLFDEPDPRNLLETIKPHIHVNGEEYGYNCIEAETIKRYGGKIYLVKRIKDISTTNILKNLYI